MGLAELLETDVVELDVTVDWLDDTELIEILKIEVATMVELDELLGIELVAELERGIGWLEVEIGLIKVESELELSDEGTTVAIDVDWLFNIEVVIDKKVLDWLISWELWDQVAPIKIVDMDVQAVAVAVTVIKDVAVGSTRGCVTVTVE